MQRDTTHNVAGASCGKLVKDVNSSAFVSPANFFAYSVPQEDTDKQVEEWRPIPGFPLYEVSSLGRIRHARKKRLIAPTLSRPQNGYLVLGLWANGVRKMTYVHRAVLLAFHGPCPEGCEAGHLNLRGDYDRTDNRPENLKWMTHAENISTRRHGRENQWTKRRKLAQAP